MRFRYSPRFALLIVLIMLLSACGSGGGGGEAQPAAGGDANLPEPTAGIEFSQDVQSGQKVVVWMVRSGPDENKWERDVVVPAWQKANPDIFVKVLNIRQDDIAVKREAMIAAGEQLDVWSPNWGGDGFASDRARGLLADLTPLIERDKFDLSDFIPEVLDIYKIDGKQWGIPFLTTGSYIYYNKELFDDAKVEYPTSDWDDASWTWAKYVETAKKLTKNIDDPNNAQFGTMYSMLNLEGPPMLFGQFVWPEDAYKTGYADKVTVSDPKSIQAFQAFHDLVYKDKVAPDPAVAQGFDQLGGAFESGRIAMMMNGGWGHWAYFKLINDPKGFCWGVAPMPMGAPDAKIRTVLWTDPWVITRGLQPDQQDLAWKFITFLASPEQQKAYTEAIGTPPVRKSLLTNYYQQFSKCMEPDKMKQVFEGAFTHGRESSNHLLVKWDSLSQAWTNVLSAYWSDPNGQAADVMPEVEQTVNDALQRINQERQQ